MPEKFQNKYRIESTRLQSWDYGWNGAYFITMVTHDRKNYFEEIENDKMIKSELGSILNDEGLKTLHIRPDMNIILDEYYQNGIVPWLRSGEVSQGYIKSAEIHITKDALKNSSAKIFPINTVLVAMYGATAGQVGILKFETSTNQAICGIYLNDKVIPEYLYLILKSQKDYLISLSGGAQPNISQKIIDGAKMVVENYMPQIDIDPDWEMVELGEVADITSSKRIYKDEYVTSGIPFYRTKEIVELSKGLQPSLELFISEERYKEIKTKYEIPKLGDILISAAVGTLGISWVVNNPNPFYFKDGNLVWFKDFKNVNSEYLKLVLDVFVPQQIHILSAGAAYNIIEFKTRLSPKNQQ